MPRPFLLLVLPLCLAACVPPPPAPEVEMPTTESEPGSELHRFTIDRAYSLGDSRELAFRDQIAAEARARCGFGDFSLYSSRPVGPEVVREDFIYRQHVVEITCER
ncbi:MAG: hypothetical protein MUC82_12555 [Cypionkella sp.]|jgi:hypothetical protein|nr:hypothetical protein [Cypionkella sp.]